MEQNAGSVEKTERVIPFTASAHHAKSIQNGSPGYTLNQRSNEMA